MTDALAAPTPQPAPDALRELAAEVKEIRQDANRLPSGASVMDATDAELEARHRLMDAGFVYGDALSWAAKIPELKQEFEAARAALAEAQP